MRREFVFGDIHGCVRALDVLVNRLALTSNDLVIVLGDAIDRGPDSRSVLDLLIDLRDSCELVYILGNHEEMMLETILGGDPEGWLRHGGKETLASYGSHLRDIPDDHLELLDSTVDYWEGSKAICVHANLEPDVELSQQTATWLRWTKLNGDELPHPSGKRVICGHSGISHIAPSVQNGWVCLDTLVYCGGYLTAAEIGSEEIFQSKQQTGEFRSGVFLHELEF